ncbi:hypothetical protein IMZ31_18845 (plasmid) [Pontibacillus sp. ALD_SL1]|uniref:hypothetical protein n=1 Tax=Pontibacillus sp. ALD_SL1 TaxID=2777185 RepID=UPI001A96E683|nr:hypothetical protein [Pontibacillus sp. ALD_SL1]QST02607.1 hypothetical protein IMZ31_18845 [Pontibacillus sp. ALD_SL1]
MVFFGVLSVAILTVILVMEIVTDIRYEPTLLKKRKVLKGDQTYTAKVTFQRSDDAFLVRLHLYTGIFREPTRFRHYEYKRSELPENPDYVALIAQSIEKWEYEEEREGIRKKETQRRWQNQKRSLPLFKKQGKKVNQTWDGTISNKNRKRGDL